MPPHDRSFLPNLQVGLIGPATVGGIKPGCMRIGNTGGMLDNIVMSKVRTSSVVGSLCGIICACAPMDHVLVGRAGCELVVTAQPFLRFVFCLSQLYRPGTVAYVSKSGGMSNELNNIIARNSDGVYEGVAIGGDRYPGTRFIDHLLRYQDNPTVSVRLGTARAEQDAHDTKGCCDMNITSRGAFGCHTLWPNSGPTCVATFHRPMGHGRYRVAM